MIVASSSEEEDYDDSIGTTSLEPQMWSKHPSTRDLHLERETGSSVDLNHIHSTSRLFVDSASRHNFRCDTPCSLHTAPHEPGKASLFEHEYPGRDDPDGAGCRSSPLDSCWSSDQQMSGEVDSLRSGSTNSVSAGVILHSSPSILKRNSVSSFKHPLRNLKYVHSHVSASNLSSPSKMVSHGAHLTSKSGLAAAGAVAGAASDGPATEETTTPEEKQHQKRLQLYIFIARCIAYPFSVRPCEDAVRRYLKINKDYLNILCERFQSFLRGELTIVCDEAFMNAVENFYETFLKSDRVANMVKAGGCSLHDIREVFVNMIKRKLQKQDFDESTGLTREGIISAWKVKFDQICRGGEGPSPVATKLAVPQAELVNPSRDQLFDMYQKILSIKKYEHQNIFNILQLDNVDEQAAQIRRELTQWNEQIESMFKNRRFPKLVHKEMEHSYVDEESKRVNALMLRLDSMPVGRSYQLSTHGTSKGAASSAVQQLQRRFMRKPNALSHSSSTLLHLGLSPSRSMLSCSSTQSARSSPMVSRQRDSISNEIHRTLPPAQQRFGLPRTAHRLSIVGCSEDAIVDPTILAGVMPTPVTTNQLNSKLNIDLDFHVEVMINRLKNAAQLGNKRIFCVLELDGTNERQRTETVPVSDACWDTVADFRFKQPLYMLKVKVCRECSGPLSMDDKEVGRMVLSPVNSHIWRSAATAGNSAGCFVLQTRKPMAHPLELQISLKVERPSNLKYCGFCWIRGRGIFKKWKLRYLGLVQVSQYKFVLAAYKPRKCIPCEIMSLDGFTVDYCSIQPELVAEAIMTAKNELKTPTNAFSSLLHINSSMESFGTMQQLAQVNHNLPMNTACHFCSLVKEGETVHMATQDDQDLFNWVQAIHRATGQSHKPVCPKRAHSVKSLRKHNLTTDSKTQMFEQLALVAPYSVDMAELFAELQHCTLETRLADPFVSLGWFSPGQNMMLDEFCARYGVRECQRYLLLLGELLDKAEHGLAIDPDLFHYAYSLCANYVAGKAQRDQDVHTVLAVERQMFNAIKTRLTQLLERQITEFRYCFPFGRPDGALEKSLCLLERVLTNENGVPVSADVVRNVIKNCLRNAAVLNYERVSEYAMIESSQSRFASGSPTRRLEAIIHLAELCIEVLQQNQEHHAESFAWFSDLLEEHAENFWSLFQMDMQMMMVQMDDENWDVFHLFQAINNYLCDSSGMRNGPFHQYLVDTFMPLVDRYISVMETSIHDALLKGMEKETWQSICHNQASTGKDSPVKSKLELPTSSAVVGLANRLATSQRMTQLRSEHAQSSKSSASRLGQRRSTLKLGGMSSLLYVVGVGSLASGGKSQRSQSATGTNGTLRKNSTEQSKKDRVKVLQESAQMAANLLSCTGTDRSCCATVSELIVRLKQLKKFLVDLNWPEADLANSLNERVSYMSANLLRDAAKLTLIELESSLRQATKNYNFVLTQQACTMVNTVIEIRAQLYPICQKNLQPDDVMTEAAACNGGLDQQNVRRRSSVMYGSSSQTGSEVDFNNMYVERTETDKMQISHLANVNNAIKMHKETEQFIDIVQRKIIQITTENLTSVLTQVLSRLTRYDEDRLLSSILSLTKPNDEDAKSYVTFIDANLQSLTSHVYDELYVLSICEKWYTAQMRQIYEWLVYRKNLALHMYQLKCISTIVRKVHSDFELQGVPDHVLDTITYQTICSRLHVEEATRSVKSESSSGPSLGSSSHRKTFFNNFTEEVNNLTKGTLFN